MSDRAIGRSSAAERPRRVKAWDGPTRLFKWLLVAAVVAAYVTQARGLIGWHVLNGYAVLILLVFRVIWGFAGSSTARFAQWVRWPTAAVRYGIDLLRGRAPRYLGHNPLGSWMILVLLLLAALQGVTGLFTVDSNGFQGGPFANLDFGDPTPGQRAAMSIHFRAFYVLLGFAAVHIVANLLYQWLKNDPLVTGIVIGTKPGLAYADETAMVPARHLWVRAALSLIAAAVIVCGSVKIAGGALPF